MTKMNYAIICLDSCRYDSFKEAYTPNFERVGILQRVYSMAGCTLPSLHSFLLNVPQYNDGNKKLFNSLPVGVWLPEYMREQGYHTAFFTNNPVALSVFNKKNFKGGFHIIDGLKYNYVYDANRIMNAIIEEFKQPRSKYVFALFMATHMPYSDGKHEHPRNRSFQVRAVEAMDREFGRLLPYLENTQIIICADHGELFGESGGWLHGPSQAVHHVKLFEVPQIRGFINKRVLN